MSQFLQKYNIESVLGAVSVILNDKVVYFTNQSICIVKLDLSMILMLKMLYILNCFKVKQVHNCSYKQIFYGIFKHKKLNYWFTLKLFCFSCFKYF